MSNAFKLSCLQSRWIANLLNIDNSNVVFAKMVRKIKHSHFFFLICDVIVNQGLVCVGLYGVSTNLVLYLIRELRQGASSAATNTSNWQGAVYFFSVIGGFVGDAYLGRYWASFLFQLLGISVSTLTYDSTHTFHYGPIVPYLTSSLLTYDSTHTFHYGPIVHI